jgi:hypothetical protein
LPYAPHLEIGRHRGWRIVETELRIGRTGCFRVTATGADSRPRYRSPFPAPRWAQPAGERLKG